MKILVTGGAGFIGSNLVDRLCRDEHEVSVLDDLSSGNQSNLHPECKFTHGSITDDQVLARVFDGVEFCFHLAAIPSVDRSRTDWLECHEVNSTGAIRVFNHAAKLGVPVIFASTAAVYGNAKKFPISEKDPINCISPYGADKFSNELQAKAFGEIHGLKSVGLRFFNVYGPKQDPSSPYSGVISIFLKKLLHGETPTIFGDGLQERDFISVSDVVSSMLLAMDRVSADADIYNICTGKGESLLELVDVICEVTGNKVDPVFEEAKLGDIRKSIGDPSLAMEKLNFQPKISLKEGLAELVKNKL